MISTNHRGGIGNVMFKLAAVISTAIDNNVDYVFSKEFIRPGIDPDYRHYETNLLRNVTFQNYLENKWEIYNEPYFHYAPIIYTPNTNLRIDGYFQNEKYFENNKQTIIDLFKPTDEHKQQILEAYPDINEYVSIHVRRGDYLNSPNHHPQMTEDFFKKSVETLGIDKTYIILSDDMEGCKNLFDFIPNKYFLTSGVDWMDMYIMSMCGDNIICNSTFSWWGAYLNENKNKKVIAPTKWFGPAYADWDTSDIYAKDWIKI
jgi:hypothetical protein